MIHVSKLTDIGPVSITTDPRKFQQDLQELFVQVGTRSRQMIILHGQADAVLFHTDPSYRCADCHRPNLL